MRRRGYLAVAGTALASGCLGTLGWRPRAPPLRELADVSIVEPEGLPISISATVPRPEITAERTARVTFSVTWHGDEAVHLSATVPFGSPKYARDPAKVLLLSEGHGRKRRNERTWLPVTGPDGHVGGDLAAGSQTVDPGVTVRDTWELWGNPRQASHIESGRHEFRDRESVNRSDPSYPWQFTLTVVE